MSVLITGAGGQVGRELAALCGPDDRALDRQALDITQPESIASVLDTHRPAVVINAAAYTAVDRAEAAPEQAQALNADASAAMHAEDGDTGWGMVLVEHLVGVGLDDAARL